MTGTSSGSLTITQCVFGDIGTNTIKNYINAVGPHKVTIERTTMSSINQAINSALIYCSNTTAEISLCNLSTSSNQPIIQIAGTDNPLTLSYSKLTCNSASSSATGVIYLTSILNPILTHSILNCGINGSAASDTPAVGLDATGSNLIFANNICLTRYSPTGPSTSNAVESSGVGSTGPTTTYYSSNYVTSSNFAHGIVSGGNFAKVANTLIA